MADPGLDIVPYHDPYDNGPYSEIMNLVYDAEHPSHDENDTPQLEEGRPNPIPLFDGGVIPDVDDPLMDQTMWGFINEFNNGGGVISQAGPSQFFGQSSGTNTPGGGTNEHNQGFGDVRLLTVWPTPPVPFSCSCCQVLREIVHFNGNNVRKLEIHGRLGIICHAVLQSHPNLDVNSSGNHQYQMFDFCKKSIEEVKRFLVQYCFDRNLEGYTMQQDPMAVFYEALCVGLEWDDILNTYDFSFPPSPPNSGRAGEMKQQPEMEQQPAVQPEAAQNNETERNPRPSLAAQRERTANMTLDDLRDYFHLPIEEAAQRLNVCPTVVKTICRRNGVVRWPFRKIKSINRQISKLRPSLVSDDAATRMHAEAEISRLEREIAQIVP